jgi:sulfur carrier protein
MTPATIRLLINSEPFELPDSATLADAVALLALTPPFAAAVNLQFVPNTKYCSCPHGLRMLKPRTRSGSAMTKRESLVLL